MKTINPHTSIRLCFCLVFIIFLLPARAQTDRLPADGLPNLRISNRSSLQDTSIIPGFQERSRVRDTGRNDQISCGQKEAMNALFKSQPALFRKHLEVEGNWSKRLRVDQSKNSQAPQARTQNIVYTLPVVVHIVHNNGSENISDAQVFNAIQHLNEAFANTGFYDPSDGVNTDIQFCLAQRDPLNQPTNGITRDVSASTNMAGPQYYSDDNTIKNINRWNTQCYVNIWVVRSIPGSVVGYAYLPSAHGSNFDGIVVEAGYFGSSPVNDVVMAHEMGHYLGLYHTFEGGCTNNDCTADGDKVCDTPPDQSTAGVGCSSSVNSCTTDALSGFSFDQPDLTQDYMDYGNFNCMKVFTAGQSNRMRWFIENVRKSLLACKSCMIPCPAPVTSSFTPAGGTLNAGMPITFINTSTNANGYRWYVNNVLVSVTNDLVYTFPSVGTYSLRLVALSNNPLCDSMSTSVVVNAICPASASFTSSATVAGAGTTITFTNTSSGATSYEWLVNGILQSTSFNYSYSSLTAGTYVITLIAKYPAAGCEDSYSDTITFTCPVVADFTPGSTTVLTGKSVNFTSTSTGATGLTWKVNGTTIGSTTTVTHVFPAPGTYVVELTATDGTCLSIKKVNVYVTDSCGNAVYLYRKSFESGSAYQSNDVQVTPDGGSIVAARLAIGTDHYGTLMKLNVEGNTEWTQSYANRSSTNLVKVRPTADGGYIAIGNAEPSGGSTNLFIVKTAANGSIAWSRELSIDASSTGTNIVQSAEGDYYFTGTLTSGFGSNVSTDAIIGKFNSTGGLQWMHRYDARGTETTSGITVGNVDVTVSGNITAAGNTHGYILQVDKAAGAVAWSRSYGSAIEDFREILATGNGFAIDVRRAPGVLAIFTDHVLLVTDLNGSVTYARYVTPFTSGRTIGYSSLQRRPDGRFIMQSSPALTAVPYQDFTIRAIDLGAGLLWSNRYGESDGRITALAIKNDHSFYASGFLESGSRKMIQLALDSNGSIPNCPANLVSEEWRQTSYSGKILNMSSATVQTYFNTIHDTTDHTVTVLSQCASITCDSIPDICNQCKTLVLSGPDSVCTSAGSFLVTAAKDSGCSFPLVWQLTGPASLLSSTDSTATVTVTDSGIVRLVAIMITACDTLYDTITVVVEKPIGKVDLGPDRTVCSLSTLNLHAGAGYLKYLWQDGSTDSVHTAFLPGQYYVTVWDRCNAVYSDTITISLAPDPSLDIGPDRIICRGDSVQLLATAGFQSYAWSSASYRISNPYAQITWVYPEEDTTYTCFALLAEGCSVIDTVRIQVRERPVSFLDTAIVICKGGTAQLIPSGKWNGYQWSGGETSSMLSSVQKGSYWLEVIDSNGCRGRDSIEVIERVCGGGLRFPNAFTPDGDGLNDLFRAVLDTVPVQYLLVVYNRWGQKVFETTKASQGWDGRYNGKRQPASTFVWYAEALFLNDKQFRRLRGTVTLIR